MPPPIIVIPSTALVLAPVSAGPDEAVAALRSAVDAAFSEGLTGRVVVVASDPAIASTARHLVPPGHRVHLGGLGRADLACTVDADPVPNVSMVQAHPGIDLAVLATRAAMAVAGPDGVADGGRLPLGPALIGIPGTTGPTAPHPTAPDQATTAAAAQAVAEALHVLAQSGPLTVVCAGDLSAGHGSKPPRPEVGGTAAADFDRQVVGALDDAEGLEHLLTRAGEVGARGLVSLLVAATLARRAGHAVDEVTATTVGGVGGLIATYR